MIIEFIRYLTASSTKEARRFGHLYESIAILERENRCRQFWLSHRENCKKFILKSCQEIVNKNNLLILGSGHLHEIPIEELSLLFNHIELVDVVHLKSTTRKFNKLKNIKFVNADITELEQNILKEKKIINKIPRLFQDKRYDMVISANLLSQIPNHLKSYLAKNAKNQLAEKELTQFALQVSHDHYQYLLNFHCPIVLITDVESQFLDKYNNVIEIQTPDFNIPFPDAGEQWWWEIAPINEVSKEYSIKMKVSAFNLNF